MSINLRLPETTELKPRITVFGVGGAGGNAVNNMIGSDLQGAEFVAANTDAQALSHSHAPRKIQMGMAITEGLGAGSRPEIGRAAAEESLPEIIDNLANTHMCFITAGMGGGTGTGAAPVIAQAAREQGILTVGVVTKPFQFEGSRRLRIAENGIHELQQYVDTLIIIPNQNLFRIANDKTTFADAFAMADEVLHSGVRGITDLMVMPGLINLDFADVRTVMNEMGKAMMGTGEASGEDRAVGAAESAISNPLLDDVSMQGAKGVLINITGGLDLTLFEVDEAANRIRSEVDPEANIIVGSTFDEALEGLMRVSVVATGIASEEDELAPEETPSANVAFLKRPEKAAWRTGPVVGTAASTTAPTPVATNMAEAPSAEPAGIEAQVPAQSRIQQPELEQPPAETIMEADVVHSPAADLIKRASEFASSKERSFTEPAEVHGVPTQAANMEPTPAHPDTQQVDRGADVTLTQPVERAASVDQQPRRRTSLLDRMKGTSSRLFAGMSEEDADAEEPPVLPLKTSAAPRNVAPRRAPQQVGQSQRPETGMPDAPKVRVDPKEQLLQSSIVEEQLEIPAFLRRP